MEAVNVTPPNEGAPVKYKGPPLLLQRPPIEFEGAVPEPRLPVKAPPPTEPLLKAVSPPVKAGAVSVPSGPPVNPPAASVEAPLPNPVKARPQAKGRRARSSDTQGAQGEGQGPRVPSWGESLLGDTTGAVLYKDFSTAVAVFGGEYKQHSAALKYLRLKCEGE